MPPVRDDLIVVEHQPRQAQNRVKRGAQLVGHVGKEYGLHAVCILCLAGLFLQSVPLGHKLFCLCLDFLALRQKLLALRLQLLVLGVQFFVLFLHGLGELKYLLCVDGVADGETGLR